MTRFVRSEDRIQGVLLPEYLDDYVAEDNPVRVIDVFVDGLDLGPLGFAQPVSLIFETRVAISTHRLGSDAPGPPEPLRPPYNTAHPDTEPLCRLAAAHSRTDSGH